MSEKYLDFNNIKECSGKEKIVKQWDIERVFNDKNSQKINSKITLTEDRLILSETRESTGYRKTSYDIKDIKAVNYSVSQAKTPPPYSVLLILIGVIVFVSGLLSAIFTSSLSVVSIDARTGEVISQSGNNFSAIFLTLLLIAIGVAAVVFGVYCFINKKRLSTKAILYIETIETKTSKLLTVLSGDSTSALQNTGMLVSLELPATSVTLDICAELEELIYELKNKNANNKKDSK